jgi:hypothetical protein
MVRAVLPIALVVGVAFAPVCARAQGQFSLKSVSVDLPPGDGMFPNGPGADAINNNGRRLRTQERDGARL